MTTAAWVMMSLSITTVLCLVSFCLSQVLFGSGPEEVELGGEEAS